MSFADELIQHARSLSDLPDEPKQVDLRRAVSAAYYALFHCFTAEAAENWMHPRQRHRFSRLFDHGRMKKACSRKELWNGDEAARLKTIALTFRELQEARHTADYDNSRGWSQTEVNDTIYRAQEAILTWQSIRETDLAQDFLLDLLATR